MADSQVTTDIGRIFTQVKRELSTRYKVVIPAVLLTFIAFFSLGILIGLVIIRIQLDISNPAEIQFTKYTAEGEQLDLYRLDETIAWEEDLGGISYNDNTLYTASPGELIWNSDKELKIIKGITYLEIDRKQTILVGNKEIQMQKGLKALYIPESKRLITVDGKVEIRGDTSIGRNRRITVTGGKFQIDDFKRENLSGADIWKEFLSQLETVIELPDELKDTSGPKLKILSPTTKQTENSKITIKGETEPGSAVRVNGTALVVDENGVFKKAFKVKNGTNTFTVLSIDSSGNNTKKIVTITKADKCTGNTQCGMCGNPACSFDGDDGGSSGGSSSFNQQLLNLINSHRAANGKGALNFDSKLNSASSKHSSWMNSTGTLSHTGSGGSQSWERCQNEGTTCDAENIAFNSSGHNANMLGSHSHIGLGKSGLYITAVFR
ncbi:MAG: CAP domain-containing protein [Candidatus Dojkabacteria bacterium]